MLIYRFVVVTLVSNNKDYKTNKPIKLKVNWFWAIFFFIWLAIKCWTQFFIQWEILLDLTNGLRNFEKKSVTTFLNRVFRVKCTNKD